MAPKRWTTSEIIICDTCKGAGTIDHSELDDYHKGEYRNWHTLCKQCNGSGRLRKTSETKEETKPYDNPDIVELMFDKLKSDK